MARPLIVKGEAVAAMANLDQAAFEAQHAAEACAGLLSLLATTCSLAVTGARPAADALLRVSRALFRFEIIEFHCRSSQG